MPSPPASAPARASRRTPPATAPRGAESRHLPRYAAGSVEVPYTIHGGQEVLERDTVWAEHSHPTHELLWNERGASTATIGRRVWTITPGIGLWVPAGVGHSGFTPAGVWQRFAQFSVVEVTPPSSVPVAVDLTPLLRLLLDRLITEELEEPSLGITTAMILDVLRPSQHELLLPIPDHPLTAHIVEAVSADPADPTTLEAWARRLGVTSRTLTRAFEAATGMSFRSWVSSARAQRAAALIASGETIEDVARQVGFRSTSAFTAAFRRVTGLTPGAFRQEIRGATATERGPSAPPPSP